MYILRNFPRELRNKNLLRTEIGNMIYTNNRVLKFLLNVLLNVFCHMLKDFINELDMFKSSSHTEAPNQLLILLMTFI